MLDRAPAPALVPLSLTRSLAFVGVPWLGFALGAYLVLPALDRAGVPLPVAVLISIGGPLVGLIAASVVAYRREGRPWAGTPFRDRFRLGRMKPSMWAWTAGLSIVMVAVPGLLSATSTRILERMVSSNAATVMGVSLAGAWWVLPVFLLLITLNVAGEELWWRG